MIPPDRLTDAEVARLEKLRKRYINIPADEVMMSVHKHDLRALLAAHQAREALVEEVEDSRQFMAWLQETAEGWCQAAGVRYPRRSTGEKMGPAAGFRALIEATDKAREQAEQRAARLEAALRATRRTEAFKGLPPLIVHVEPAPHDTDKPCVHCDALTPPPTGGETR